MEELNEIHLSVEDILERMEKENPVTPEEKEDQKQRVLSILNEKEKELFYIHFPETKSFSAFTRDKAFFF